MGGCGSADATNSSRMAVQGASNPPRQTRADLTALDRASLVVYSYWTVRASQDPRLAVGLIVLGNMGTAFAERLLDAGYPLVVSNRTPQRAEALAARGAAVATSTSQLAERV